MNISQAMFISAFIGPSVSTAIGFLQVVQAVVSGLLCFYLSIKLIEDE